MMKRVKFFIFLLPAIILLFALPRVALAETIDLTSVADSFVNDGYPDNNYGSAHSLITSYNSVYRWSLTRFDLSSLPGEAQIDTAVLKVYLYGSSGDASVPTMAARITGDWTESGVKWNNRPMFDESTGVTTNIDTATGYKSWDITEIVRGWQNNDFSNYGLALGHGSGNYSRSFRSREYASNHPKLSITYHLPEPSPSPSPVPSPSPSPSPGVSPTPEVTEEVEEEPSPTPEESPSPSPEAEEGKILGLFSLGQALIGALILLALIGAGISFATYARRKPEKKVKKSRRKVEDARHKVSAKEQEEPEEREEES